MAPSKSNHRDLSILLFVSAISLSRQRLSGIVGNVGTKFWQMRPAKQDDFEYHTTHQHQHL